MDITPGVPQKISCRVTVTKKPANNAAGGLSTTNQKLLPRATCSFGILSGWITSKFNEVETLWTGRSVCSAFKYADFALQRAPSSLPLYQC